MRITDLENDTAPTGACSFVLFGRDSSETADSGQLTFEDCHIDTQGFTYESGGVYHFFEDPVKRIIIRGCRFLTSHLFNYIINNWISGTADAYMAEYWDIDHNEIIIANIGTGSVLQAIYMTRKFDDNIEVRITDNRIIAETGTTVSNYLIFCDGGGTGRIGRVICERNVCKHVGGANGKIQITDANDVVAMHNITSHGVAYGGAVVNQIPASASLGTYNVQSMAS